MLSRVEEGHPLYFVAQVRDNAEHRQVEQQLREANSRLAALLQNIQAGVLVENESRQIVNVNEDFCEMFGIPAPPRALLGTDCSDAAEAVKDLFVEPEMFARRIEELLRDRRTVAGEELRLKDGRTFERDYVPVFADKDYRGHMWTYRDISGRKRTERALRKSEEQFRSLVESIAEWIWEVDLQARIMYSNPAIKEILGYDPEEVTGKDSLELIHEEDRREVERVLPKFIANKQGWRGLVLRWRHKDGGYRYLESNAVPILDDSDELLGYRGADHDITERKRAQEALKEQQHFLRSVIDTDPNLVFVKDQDGRFVLANEAVANIYGTTVEELVGKTDAGFNTNPEEVVAFRQTDREVIGTLREKHILEEPITEAHTGKVRWFQTYKVPLEAVMNSIKNGLEMRKMRTVKTIGRP